MDPFVSVPRCREKLQHGRWRWTVVLLWMVSTCSACKRHGESENATISGQRVDGSTPDGHAIPRTPRPGRRILDVPIPELKGRVNDYAPLLSSEEARALEAKLAEHEARTGQQFALLTVERLPEASIEDFGFTVANRWKLGRACYHDGALLLIALADRKLRIDVGYGLERAIPDERAALVVQEMTPLLRLGKYGEAANVGFDRLIAAASASPALKVKGCEKSP